MQKHQKPFLGGMFGWISLAVLFVTSFSVTMFVATHASHGPSRAGPIATHQNAYLRRVDAERLDFDAENTQQAQDRIDLLQRRLAATDALLKASQSANERLTNTLASLQSTRNSVASASSMQADNLEETRAGANQDPPTRNEVKLETSKTNHDKSQHLPSPAPPEPKAITSSTIALSDPRLPPVGGPASKGICWTGFDFGYIEAWKAPGNTKHMCKGNPDLAAPIASSLFLPNDPIPNDPIPNGLVCYSARHAHLSQPAAPHVMCRLTGGWFDFDQMAPAQCPKSRPGWKCDGPPVYHTFKSGFINGQCSLTSALNPKDFSQDHFRDMFAAFKGIGSGNKAGGESPPPADAWGLPSGPLVAAGAPAEGTDIAKPAATTVSAVAVGVAPSVVLAVTRERGEHANLFHATTDFLNAFIALHAMGLIDAQGTSAEAQRASIQGTTGVLLLDEQAEGPFDSVWENVFAPLWGVRRPSVFRPPGTSAGSGGARRKGGGRGGGGGGDVPTSGTGQHDKVPEATKPGRGSRLGADEIVFVGPGYATAFFHQNRGDALCRQPVRLYRAYRSFFLAGYGIAEPVPIAGAPLKVMLVSRKPYNKFVEHSFVGRQISNEEALLAALGDEEGRAVFGPAGAIVERVDFVHLTYEEQVRAVASTDILIGMHGAALTHSLLLPPWGGVMELWPKQTDMWRCFEHMTELASGNYARWSNPDPRKFRKDVAGDYTEIDPRAMVEEVKALVGTVSMAKQAALNRMA